MNFWNFNELKRYPKLNQTIETEVLVIGGGLSGIFAAYKLKQKGFEVVVVEKGRIGHGTTKKTTASLSVVEDFAYQDLIKEIGLSKAKLYYEALRDGIESYETLSKDFFFDFKKTPFYKTSIDKVWFHNEINALKQLDIPYEVIKNDSEYIFKTEGAMINPKLLIECLIKDLTIYEDTDVLELDNEYAVCQDAAIKAKHIVIATNYPILKIRGKFFLKLHQNASYVEVIKKESKNFASGNGASLSIPYYRQEKDFTLKGSKDRRVGFSLNDCPKTLWKNQDSVSIDDIPYIGKIKHKEYYIISGFSLFGMVKAKIAADIISDLLLHKNNRYEELFSIYRPLAFKQVMKQIKIVLKSFIKLKKRCTHLGCTLKYNEKEGIYECGCHGSTFSEDGKRLVGPANKNLK